ncbi:immunity protein Imm33 domain-containing protein [Variovorax paradoxus]
MHVEHISEILPIAQKYLALAPGFKFIIDENGYEDVWYEPESNGSE